MEDVWNNISICKRHSNYWKQMFFIAIIAESEIEYGNAHCINGHHNNLDCCCSNDEKLNVDTTTATTYYRQFMPGAWNYELRKNSLNNNHPLFLLQSNFQGNDNNDNSISVS
eukprot:13677696-Ditylum_brightwellii.AAC.1